VPFGTEASGTTTPNAEGHTLTVSDQLPAAERQDKSDLKELGARFARWATVDRFAELLALEIAVILLELAIIFDGRTENVLVEAAGLAASVAVTLAVVELALSRRRENEYAAVRTQTHSALSHLVAQATLDLFLALPEPRRDGLVPPVLRPEAGFGEVLRSIATRCAQMATPEDTLEAERSRFAHSRLVPTFHTLSQGVGPRVLFTADPELIEHTGEVESAFRAWDGARYQVEEEGLPAGMLWEDTARAARALGVLEDYLSDASARRR
jgi:hypothetical protein